jgi:hypothetical protein
MAVSVCCRQLRVSLQIFHDTVDFFTCFAKAAAADFYQFGSLLPVFRIGTP